MLARPEADRRTPAEPGRPAPTGTRVRRRTGSGSHPGSSAVPQAADPRPGRCRCEPGTPAALGGSRQASASNHQRLTVCTSGPDRGRRAGRAGQDLRLPGMRRGHQQLSRRSPFRPASARPPADSSHTTFPARELVGDDGTSAERGASGRGLAKPGARTLGGSPAAAARPHPPGPRYPGTLARFRPHRARRRLQQRPPSTTRPVLPAKPLVDERGSNPQPADYESTTANKN
jgi:hypothetical protein